MKMMSQMVILLWCTLCALCIITSIQTRTKAQVETMYVGGDKSLSFMQCTNHVCGGGDKSLYLSCNVRGMGLVWIHWTNSKRVYQERVTLDAWQSWRNYIYIFPFIIRSILPSGICHSRGHGYGGENFPLLFGVHYHAESPTSPGSVSWKQFCVRGVRPYRQGLCIFGP
jgi:hypothetical protein